MQIFPLSFSLPLTHCLHTLWLVYHLRFTTITNNLLRCLLLSASSFSTLASSHTFAMSLLECERIGKCGALAQRRPLAGNREELQSASLLSASHSLCVYLSLFLCMCVHVYACSLQSIFTFLTNYQFSALCCAVDKSSLAAADADANANVDSQRFCGWLRLPPTSTSLALVSSFNFAF